MPLQAKANLSALIESTQDLIWSVDLEYRLIAFNKALEKDIQNTCGVQLEVGKVFHDALPPERAALWPPFYERALYIGSFRAELVLVSGRTIEFSFSPIVADGEAIGISVFGKDISEREQAEAALKENLELLKEAQAIGNLGSYVLDIGAGVWTSSDALDGILGIGPEYARTDAGWKALVHPDDRDMVTAYFEEEVIGKRQNINKEFRIIRQTDHAERWVHGIGRLQLDAQGQPWKIHGVIKDITDRKLAEKELRDSEARYRTVFQISQDCVSVSYQQDGRFVDVNQEFLRLLGYERSEVIGRTSQELHIWADPENRLKLVEAMRKDLVVRDMEFLFQRKNGEQFWVLLSGSRIDLEGVPSFLIVVRDISAAKAANERLAAAAEALRLSEERYRTIFQTSLDAVCIVRLSDEMFIDVNQALLHILGYEREEVVGKTGPELGIFADDRDRLHVTETLRQSGICRDLEFPFKRKDGGIVWGNFSASIIEIGGVVFILTMVQDISAAKAATDALRASELRYRTTFQTSLDAVCLVRLSDETVVEVNQSLLDILGYEREEVVEKTALELGVFADDSDRQAVLELLRQDGTCRDFEVRFRKKNGETGWGRLSSSIIEIGGVAFILSMVQDISAAKAAADALQTSEVRYRTVFQTSLDAICITRLSDGTFVDVNQSFLDILGYEREDAIGKTAQELGIWADNREREAMVEIIRKNSICRALEARFRRKNGTIVWGEISASIIDIDGVPCILSLTRDMTPVRTAERTIQSLAFYDPLTGLLNRHQLLEQLRQTLAAGAQNLHLRALLLIDLDNFKALKETLGYRIVDILLMEVARRIAACARAGDTVYRLGGDQFVVILEGLSKVAEEAATQAGAVGERILDAVGHPYPIEGRECLATTCLGITVFGDRLRSTDEIMQQADIALHRAKAAGDGVARFFSPDLQASVNARAALEEELRQGIKKKQFMLYYQPQVDRGRITGAEALIRWNHPTRGLVLPDEFIPIAEESRLILPLGDWILKTACEQIAAWEGREQTSHLVLSVNISILQLRQPDFVEHVLAALDRARANPRNLRLELTESMLVEDIDQIIAKMAELKFHGLRFSLDDFGTGYSSLAYLKRLPLDCLKIDRSFVRDILVDSASGAIAQTIISLGRAMGLLVVAEGVETEEQWGYLSGLDCHSFQGYLLSYPLPLKEFQTFLDKFN